MKTLVAILQLLPAIISAVKAIEEALPISGKGKEKLDLVLGLVGDLGEDANALKGPVEKAVGRVVSMFKATGVFGGKDAAPAS